MTEIEVFGVDDPTVARLRAIDGVTSVSVEDRDQAQLLVVQTTRRTRGDRAAARGARRLEVGRVSSREPTLEDAYVSLVTAAMSDAPPASSGRGFALHFKNLSASPFMMVTAASGRSSTRRSRS